MDAWIQQNSNLEQKPRDCYFFLQMWHRVWKIFRKIFSLMDYVLSSLSEYFLTSSEALVRFNSGMENCRVNQFNSTTIICGELGAGGSGTIQVSVCLSNSKNQMLSVSKSSSLNTLTPPRGLKTSLPTQFWKMNASQKDGFGFVCNRLYDSFSF